MGDRFGAPRDVGIWSGGLREKSEMFGENTQKLNKKSNVLRTYNVTIRRVRATMVAWKSKKYYIFWVWVCSLRYAEWNTNASYFHLWSVQIHNIFPNYHIRGMIFENKFTEHKIRVLVFHIILSGTFPILRRNERDIVILANTSLYIVLVIFVRF